MPQDIQSPSRNISKPARLWMRRWLILIGFLVYAMILVGGATRLTDSGLSITEWKPISGALPPMSSAEWAQLFDLYKQTAEFQLQNASMNMAEFQYIYWWEWGHRLLGRLIGLVAVIGFVIFMMRGWLKDGWAFRFGFLIVLGGLQGAIGWWMVASGIGETSRVDVAPYRLMTHFCLALLIIGFIAWYWMQLGQRSKIVSRVPLPALPVVLGALIFLQMASGALVAGLDAGRTYTDWPMMAGEFVPQGYWASELGIRNIFENHATAQFNHRIIAYLITILAVVVAFVGRERSNVYGTNFLLAAIGAQVLWGILTLMNAAPLSLALVHQGLGVIVLIAAIRTVFRARYSVSAAN